MNRHRLLLTTPSPPSSAFPSVIFLTPPKDDMEIHVSASLTMRSHKAIKRGKKRKTGTSECLSLSCLLIDDKENDWEVLDSRGRRRQTGRISFVESNIQKQDVLRHFGLPFLLLYYINQRASGKFIWTVCHRDVLRREKKKRKTTKKKHPLEMSLSWQWYQLSCLKWSRPLHYLEINS